MINNVAYNTYGHCYFMEDGGEKNNTFHHNLGLLTQRMVPDVLDRNGTIPSVCQQFVYSIFCQYNICLTFFRIECHLPFGLHLPFQYSQKIVLQEVMEWEFGIFLQVG